MTEREQVLLSLQRALLGAITPNVRSVSCNLSANVIAILVIFEAAPSNDDLERMSVVETEVLADFPPSRQVRLVCESISGQRISHPSGDLVAYRRYEGE